MDKDSDERMAPALHSADHEAVDTIITSLKYSSSSSPSSIVQSETDVFQQYNGILSGQSRPAESGKNNQYFDTLKYDSPSKTLQLGSSGDFGRMVPYLHDATASKINSMRYHFGSGDASKHIKKDTISFDSDEMTNVDCKESLSIGKTAITLAKTLPLNTAVFVSTMTGSSESQMPSSSPEKKLSIILPSIEDASKTTATFDNETKRTSALLVNVDKHESINPHIIHTTSITTSALAISDLQKSNHEKEKDSGYVNGKTLQHHRNNCLKHSFVTSPDSTNFTRERTYQPVAVADIGVKQCFDPIDHSTIISTFNSGESVCSSSDASEHISIAREEQNLAASNAQSISNSEASTAIATKTNSVPFMVSINSQCDKQEKDDQYSASATLGVPHTTQNSRCNEIVSGSMLIGTILTQISTFTNTSNSLTLSSSSQASMSSVTHTTPVYHHTNSIPAFCVKEIALPDSSVQLDDNFSLPVSKSSDNLSLNQVPDLQNLAEGLVSGHHMDQLPINVTNMLQELAASLTQTQESDKSAQNIEWDGSLKKSDYSQRSLNVSETHLGCSVLSNIKDIDIQHKSQYLDTIKCNSFLDNRISSLQSRLNILRSAGISRHSKKHLSDYKLPKALPTPHREHTSPISRHAMLKSGILSKNLPEISSKVDADYSATVTHTDHGTKKSRRFSVFSLPTARDKLGVLKKELNDSRRRVDPYLTESSSDEETSDSLFTKLSTTTTTDSSTCSGFSLSIDKTAAWNWAYDRISIAQRWTWLNAQVTGLEFKIKQQRDLHKQLRQAKNKQSERITYPTSNVVGVSLLDSTPSHSVADNDSTNVYKAEPNDATCARVRPILHRLPNRRVLRTSDITALSDKKLKPPTVHNNNVIMLADQPKHTPYHRADGRPRGIVYSSMRSRASIHDHCYHKILSTPEDVSISTRLSGHLLTNNKHFAAKLRKSEQRSEKNKKRRMQESRQRDDRVQEKLKSRPRSATVVLERADKLLRSISSLQRNTSYEDRISHHDFKKRRSTASLSEVNKRNRITSVDSDAESSHNRSDAGTPVFDSSASYYNNPQYQAVLKRKRANDQAYDINNIVIPHGLSSARIEKLQYKEILTPGWRTTKHEAPKTTSFIEQEPEEDDSDSVFKCRHDRHEILEKKKYMNFLEMNINKRTGARTMSRANLPLDDPASFFTSSNRSSPTNMFPPSEFPVPASPEPLSPSVVLRSRRSSSELSLHSNASLQLSEQRHRILDSASSEDGNHKIQREPSTYECWEARSFPLSQHEIDEMTNDPVVFLKKLPHEIEEASRMFQPIPGLMTQDSASVQKEKLTKLDVSAGKRPRRSSHASNFSRDDDRQSDDSVMSSRSLHRVRSCATDVSAAIPEQNLVGHLYSQRKRHKAVLKDDFYYYSDMNTSGQSGSDSDSDGSSDSKIPKPSVRVGEQWVSRPVSRESTPKRSTSGDDHTGDETSPGHKPPLLLKVKKKFIFK